jgi:hypothetical protein
MADHPNYRPLTITLSDCPAVPSYCEGFCPAESDGRARYRQPERRESPLWLHRRGGRDENRRQPLSGCGGLWRYRASLGEHPKKRPDRKYVSWLVAGAATSFIAITPLRVRQLRRASVCRDERAATPMHGLASWAPSCKTKGLGRYSIFQNME